MPFAAVATSLQTGAEVWLRSGSTLDAVRASIAVPGLFTPVLREGSVLVDGGLVNPVPVSLAPRDGCRSGDRGSTFPLTSWVVTCALIPHLKRRPRHRRLDTQSAGQRGDGSPRTVARRAGDAVHARSAGLQH